MILGHRSRKFGQLVNPKAAKAQKKRRFSLADKVNTKTTPPPFLPMEEEYNGHEGKCAPK